MPNNQETLVLVADDEPSTLALVAAHVRSKGFKVVEASDGDMAWQLAHEHLPDLVILDVMMPGMSGWEVCRKIRESLPLAHTGVIMLTGIGEHLNEMTSPLYGADTHVDKPFEFADLDDKIDATLRQRREGAFGRPDRADERNADDEEFDEDRRPVLTQPSPSLGSSADSSEDDEPAPHAVRLAPTGVRKAKRAAAWTDPVGEAGAGSAGKSTPKASKTQPPAAKAPAKPAKPAKKAAAKPAERSATKQAAKKASKKKATEKQATKKAPAKKATAKKAAKKATKAPAKKATAKKATAKKATAKKATKKAPAKKAAKKATAKKATKKAPAKKAAKKATKKKKSGKRR